MLVFSFSINFLWRSRISSDAATTLCAGGSTGAGSGSGWVGSASIISSSTGGGCDGAGGCSTTTSFLGGSSTFFGVGETDDGPLNPGFCKPLEGFWSPEVRWDGVAGALTPLCGFWRPLLFGLASPDGVLVALGDGDWEGVGEVIFDEPGALIPELEPGLGRLGALVSELFPYCKKYWKEFRDLGYLNLRCCVRSHNRTGEIPQRIIA